MPSRARHGTPIPITEKEYKAVMDKWSDIAEENDEEEKPEPVLSYDFEESDGTVIKDIIVKTSSAARWRIVCALWIW